MCPGLPFCVPLEPYLKSASRRRSAGTDKVPLQRPPRLCFPVVHPCMHAQKNLTQSSRISLFAATFKESLLS